MIKIKPKKKKLTAQCSQDECQRRAKAKRECLTCEKLVEAGKSDTVFTVFACAHHQEEGIAKIKRHALVSHPMNIIRATVAQLKGMDVF